MEGESGEQVGGDFRGSDVRCGTTSDDFKLLVIKFR